MQIKWIFFVSQLQKSKAEYIAAGDEVVFGKAGKETYGIGRFFSSLQNRIIRGLSFFMLSVIHVKERQSYSIQAVQMVKPCAEPSDLKLSYEKLYEYYTLRFQIEFNFRDAKQYWSLDDFMNVKQDAVTNAANLSFFIVNFSAVLLRHYRGNNPAFSVLGFKSHYRGCRYTSETIKLLPQKPDGILLAEIFEQIARLGKVHSAFKSVPTS